jgi:hypothetical protein
MVVHKIELLNVVIPWMTPFIKDDWLIHSYVLMKYQPVVKLAMKIHVPHIIGTLVSGPLVQQPAMVALNPQLSHVVILLPALIYQLNNALALHQRPLVHAIPKHVQAMNGIYQTVRTLVIVMLLAVLV